MDLIKLLLYFFFTPNVAIFAQLSKGGGGSGDSGSSSSSSSSSSSNSGSNSNAINNSNLGTTSISSTSRSLSGSDGNNILPSMSPVKRELIRLAPTTSSEPHFVNDSFIVFCKTEQENIETKWKDPNGEVRENTKGRVHIEKKAGYIALVFEHMVLADKGNWTCEGAANTKDVKEKKSFEILVYQKISFDNKDFVQSAREGRDAKVPCLVKGDPTPEVSWLFNGESINIYNSTKYRITSSELYIKNVTQSDAGEYTCRAMRITPTFADSDQITILLRIQHKPHWMYPDMPRFQYAYIGGVANISCDAMGEPPPSFTWLHNGRPISGKNYRWFYADYGSTLQVQVVNDSHFGDYKCKVANPLGMLERVVQLHRGQKPAAPSRLELRRVFTNGFDFDIRSVKHANLEDNMQTVGYRVEYMSQHEFKFGAGNWTYAKWKDFLFHRDGRRFVLSDLQSNTTYLLRAASRNLAGLSDWSPVKSFNTLSSFALSTASVCIQHFIIIVGLSFLWNFCKF